MKPESSLFFFHKNPHLVPVLRYPAHNLSSYFVKIHFTIIPASVGFLTFNTNILWNPKVHYSSFTRTRTWCLSRGIQPITSLHISLRSILLLFPLLWVSLRSIPIFYGTRKFIILLSQEPAPGACPEVSSP